MKSWVSRFRKFYQISILHWITGIKMIPIKILHRWRKWGWFSNFHRFATLEINSMNWVDNQSQFENLSKRWDSETERSRRVKWYNSRESNWKKQKFWIKISIDTRKIHSSQTKKAWWQVNWLKKNKWFWEARIRDLWSNTDFWNVNCSEFKS